MNQYITCAPSYVRSVCFATNGVDLIVVCSKNMFFLFVSRGTYNLLLLLMKFYQHINSFWTAKLCIWGELFRCQWNFEKKSNTETVSICLDSHIVSSQSGYVDMQRPYNGIHISYISHNWKTRLEYIYYKSYTMHCDLSAVVI